MRLIALLLCELLRNTGPGLPLGCLALSLNSSVESFSMRKKSFKSTFYAYAL
jgi:hypothetical protein